jgi:hypothetical protein
MKLPSPLAAISSPVDQVPSGHSIFSRRHSMPFWLLTIGISILSAASALPLHGQRGPAGSKGTPPIVLAQPVFIDSKAPDYGPPPERTPTFADLQYRKYVISRLESMVTDADKLLKLAKDLNKRTDTPATNPRDDLRTVSEIEKLAHNVKWKMQLAANANPNR